jgi:hypothetical protein
MNVPDEVPMVISPVEFANILVEAGLEPRNYSGRFMYGAQCIGVTVPHKDVLALGTKIAAQAAASASENLVDEAEGFAIVTEALDAVKDIMSEARQDEMGLDAIVYWPDMKWSDEVGDIVDAL